jgi:glyoxylate/hydroxypyruvate reductase A
MTTRNPVIIDLKFEPTSVEKALAGAFAGREVINLSDPGEATRDLSSAAYAVVWKPHGDLFSRARNLKAVFSGGAGVDHVLKLDGLPDIPLIRFVDPTLTNRMSEWVVMQALLHLRQHSRYEMQRHDRRWNELPQPEAADVTIGMMGLGVLGQDSARKLRMMGFRVIGWSRGKKIVEGMETFAGDELDAFLGRTDMLVGLLPLTDDTTAIFNAGLFRKLRRDGALGGPVFINAGRGGSQVESDLVKALTDGTLLGASLDVFETEPLPASSPFWSMQNVFMTPHAAASTDVRALFAHVERQIDRFESGRDFDHVVNRATGY